MTDWKEQLKEAYQVIRDKKKSLKPETSTKFDNEVNFKGRSGYNDTGIPLSPKTIKQKNKNKSIYAARAKAKYWSAGSQLKNINDYTNTESLINLVNNALIGLDEKLIFLNFVNAQLVNYINSNKKSSTYLRRLKNFDTTKGFHYLKQKVDLISMPTFAHIEKDFEKEILEFLKNINDFGITNSVHLISLNNETLKFINRIDSKLIFNLNRVLN